jgi:hypothetical protein
VTDLFNTDWDTVDLRKLRALFDAEQLAAGKVTRSSSTSTATRPSTPPQRFSAFSGRPRRRTRSSRSPRTSRPTPSVQAPFRKVGRLGQAALPLRGLDNTPCE